MDGPHKPAFSVCRTVRLAVMRAGLTRDSACCFCGLCNRYVSKCFEAQLALHSAKPYYIEFWRNDLIIRRKDS